jgi:hypothetical protein
MNRIVTVVTIIGAFTYVGISGAHNIAVPPAPADVDATIAGVAIMNAIAAFVVLVAVTCADISIKRDHQDEIDRLRNSLLRGRAV